MPSRTERVRARGLDRALRLAGLASRRTALPLAILIVLASLADPAATTAARPPTAREIERFYNPFGDPWAINKGPNPSIPVGLTPACHRRGLHAQLSTLTQEEIRFLARSSSPIVVDSCADIPENNPKLRAIGAALKRAAPRLKYVGYLTPDLAPTNVRAADNGFPGLRAIDRREEWFVHKQGLPPTRANRLKSHGRFPQDVLDLTNPQFQSFLASAVARSLRSHNMGGVAIDGCGKQPLARDPNEVDPRLRASWADGCLSFLAKLKRAVGGDKLVLVTGIDEYGELISGNSFTEKRLRITDGLAWEDPMADLGADLRLSSPSSHIQRINLVFDIARRAGNKYAAVWVNTNTNGPNGNGRFATTNRAREQAFARYYLALYLNITRGERTPLLYYTPVPTSAQFHSEAFFRDWNLRIGNPTGRSEEVFSDRRHGAVLRRPFRNSQDGQNIQWAYVNNTQRPFPVQLRTAAPLYTADGAPLACRPRGREFTCTHTLAPKSGALFITRATLNTR